MKREKQLPDAIFISPKVSEMLEFRITEAGACLDSDNKGINIKDASLSDAFFDDTTEFRNTFQLWNPAEENPIVAVLCSVGAREIISLFMNTIVMMISFGKNSLINIRW